MQEQNIDVNLIIQSFQERINQLITETIIKDATIRHLNAQIHELTMSKNDFVTPNDNTKKDK